jgi:hypothetical protein
MFRFKVKTDRENIAFLRGVSKSGHYYARKGALFYVCYKVVQI